jgi:hypothetical protein
MFSIINKAFSSNWFIYDDTGSTAIGISDNFLSATAGEVLKGCFWWSCRVIDFKLNWVDLPATLEALRSFREFYS